MLRRLVFVLWQCWHMLTLRQKDLDDIEERYGL